MPSLFTSDRQFHLQILPEEVGRYVILPGDPGRVPKIAALLEHPVLVAQNREYVTYTGSLLGEKVSVVSTGIGGPSAAIALEELAACGVHTAIRIGTSGGMDEKVVGGDLVVASAAVRAEGTSREYLPQGYPAAADFDVVCALHRAGAALSEDADGKRVHVGVIHSKDSFYGEVYPGTMPVSGMLTEQWGAYLKCGCLASEMEAAALFSVGLVRRVRVGAVLTALWNVERSAKGLSDPVCSDSSRAIRCAVDAVALLIRKDRSEE